MKTLTVLFALIVTIQANATSILPRPISDINYELLGVEENEPADCGYGLNLKTNIFGDQFVVNNTYVYGFNCPVFVKDPVDDRTERFYYIANITVDGCGSKYILANRIYKLNEKGVEATLIVADHSKRVCRDFIHKSKYEITENIGGMETLYLAKSVALPKPRPLPIEKPAPITCMAYWTGFERIDGRCVELSTSGCSNPFTYKSQVACESDL